MERFYEKFVRKISMPIILKRDGLGGLLDHYYFLNRSQYWNENELDNYRLEKIRQICIHAYENTEFYKIRFDQCGFNPYQFSDYKDLKKIPVLTKNEIKNNLNQLIANNIERTKLHLSETGGTTGVKMTFYRDNACLPKKEAALFRFDNWAGWKPGQRYGIVWPAQQDYVGHWTLKNRIRNSLYKREVVFPAAILNDQLISGFIRKIKKYPPAILRVFTSPIVEISEYLIKNGIHIKGIEGVVTTGEPLYPFQRRKIERAFICPVYNSYRSREAGPIAQECENHEGLHINAESLFVEIRHLDDLQNDENGEILITDLLNYGMPLIRYRMGDLGRIITKKCSCGRAMPLLDNLAGRTGDVLYTPEGEKIISSSLVLYLVDEAPGNLGQVQVVQDEVDHILIRMTKDPPVADEIIDYQKRTVNRLFGESMRMSFEFVDKIDREPSGKYIFAKNLVKK